MSEDLVERVARVLVSPKADPSDWRFWTDEARAAIAVLRPALRAEALEEAAKVCERRFMGDHNREDMEARRCAAAIRNLIPKEVV